MKISLWMVAGLALAAVGLPADRAEARAERVTCRVELDRSILPAGANQRAVVKVSLDAPAVRIKTERTPINLAIVLDRSGSMGSDQKLEKAKQAAIEALRRLGERDRFSLVIFDHEVETVVPPQSASNTEWIESRIREIRSRGNTALFGGVSQGAAEIRKNLDGHYVHRILLLSDGQANVGPRQPEDLGRLGKALLKEHIAVTTIGVGTDYNEDLMTRLAQQSDGNTYFVESSADLPRIFAAELGDVLSVFAREVVLKIDFADGIRPLRIIGRDGRLGDRTVEIRLNQLYGGQEKYALVEVEVPAGRPRDTQAVATARCTYENLLSRRTERAEDTASVRFSAYADEVKRSANGPVQRDIAINALAIAKDEAVRLADKGDYKAAGGKLREASIAVKTQVSIYDIKDDRLLKEADAVGNAAPGVAERGFDNRQRKEAVTDSYQIRNQQSNQ